MATKSKVISANSLFHFTSKIEYLLNILSNGIHPRFCIEDIRAFTPETIGLKEVAQPMSCFCDIPLSSIHEHVSKYGNFGIGFTKEWGMKKGISPVMYVYPHSVSSDLVRLVLFKAFLTQMDDKTYDEVIGPMHALKNYFKVSTGQMFNNGEFSGKEFNFYDEREWRFVPVNQITRLALREKSARVFLTKEEFINPEVKEYHNLLMADNCSLTFTPEDIKYIFVSTENDVVKVIDYLESDYLKRYPKMDVRLLFNKIISLEKMLSDV